MTGEKSTNGPLTLPPTITKHLQSVLGDGIVEKATIREAKSAQQQVFIVALSSSSCHPPCSLPPIWQEALESGRHNIVIRIWKGSARWWNLHSSHAVSEFNESADEPAVLLLARAEIAGYRVARDALLLEGGQAEIPKVLYFSHDDHDSVEKQPWAIMSYVGPENAFFDEQRVPSSEWMDGMVKNRPEFGFDEPHPRWGRVPVDDCLDYVFHVLERFTIPLHRYFLLNEDGKVKHATKPRTYNDMVKLYEKAHDKIVQELQDAPLDKTQTKMVNTLGLCIQRLAQETDVKNLPPVLCHMDCQPQNLIFYRQEDNTLPQLHSVLDWEEAAFADPRFEILLLCRKVCANQSQADAVWEFYTKELHKIDSRLTVGPIDPWLKLETVHSITTLVLQSMNLLNGGRAPWEARQDLLRKLEREYQRLAWAGWAFCDTSNPSNG